jgi:hypothetical protein
MCTNCTFCCQTLPFPHRSSRGNEYLLVVYDYDSNSILHCALKNKTGAEIKRGWLHIHEKLARGGNQPNIYILDNEASTELKRALAKYDLSYQLVPPMSIAETLLSAGFAPPKVIFWRVWSLAILTFPSLNGTVAYSKLNSR